MAPIFFGLGYSIVNASYNDYILAHLASYSAVGYCRGPYITPSYLIYYRLARGGVMGRGGRLQQLFPAIYSFTNRTC